VKIGWIYLEPKSIIDDWETATISDANIDSIKLFELIRTINSTNQHRIHGILIARHGKLVFEEYFDGYRRRTPSELINFNYDVIHDLASVTKSVTSLLLGIALDHGYIDSLKSSISHFFPEFPELKQGNKKILNLEHMINMVSGLEWDQHSLSLYNPDNDLNVFSSSDQPWELYLTRPMEDEPGNTMNYSEASINVVGECIKRSYGMRLDQFASDLLFKKLNINEAYWLVRPSGWVWASGELFITPRSMLKIGQLYLQNGIWNGEQIVSHEWINRLKNPYTKFDANSHWHEQGWLQNADMYGYKDAWWNLMTETYGNNAFTASGWGEQRIMVLPEFDMVVVFTGGSQLHEPLFTAHEMMTSYILPSIQK
jgi:CubicO group peptidase (beta-lactamase class C family)